MNYSVDIESAGTRTRDISNQERTVTYRCRSCNKPIYTLSYPGEKYHRLSFWLTDKEDNRKYCKECAIRMGLLTPEGKRPKKNKTELKNDPITFEEAAATEFVFPITKPKWEENVGWLPTNKENSWKQTVTHKGSEEAAHVPPGFFKENGRGSKKNADKYRKENKNNVKSSLESDARECAELVREDCGGSCNNYNPDDLSWMIMEYKERFGDYGSEFDELVMKYLNPRYDDYEGLGLYASKQEVEIGSGYVSRNNLQKYFPERQKLIERDVAELEKLINDRGLKGDKHTDDYAAWNLVSDWFHQKKDPRGFLKEHPEIKTFQDLFKRIILRTDPSKI